MEKQRILILDKERINWKLQRMAYEIWEHNSNESSVTLIGIEGSGATVANNLAERLRNISPLAVDVINLKMNKKEPSSGEIKMNKNISDKSVILVDDVANSGRTLLYSLRPLLSADLKKVMIVVLVERKHKAFPISPDIVGYSVATTLQERIVVETKDNEIEAAYLE
jgi:pyrimidine operon attenuation protein/uracil phosphoribosyltransferase